jgi:hypothetical protein
VRLQEVKTSRDSMPTQFNVVITTLLFIALLGTISLSIIWKAKEIHAVQMDVLPPSALARFHTPHNDSCLDINSNVPSDVAFAKGYNEAHADWLGLNGRHGFDDSTSLKDKTAYQLGYKEGWIDASKGIYQQDC